MTEIDVQAMIRLKANRRILSYMQYKTLKGQILSGNSGAAMKGLTTILKAKARDAENK